MTTTNDAVTVGCSQLSTCEICYWPASTITSNCQQQSDTLTCRDIPVGDRTDLSTLLDNDGTYCYRATAIVDGTPVVVTQDTFNKRQRISGTYRTGHTKVDNYPLTYISNTGWA